MGSQVLLVPPPPQMERVRQAKLCHEVLVREGRKVDFRASWQRWEDGARQQAQLKEEALSARKSKERQRKMAQVSVCVVPSPSTPPTAFGRVLCRSIVTPSRWRWRRRHGNRFTLTCSRRWRRQPRPEQRRRHKVSSCSRWVALLGGGAGGRGTWRCSGVGYHYLLSVEAGTQ